MKRGEVWWVSFDSSLGGEIQKTRPAVIVSNNAANKALNRVQVVPLTSQTERLYPAEALVVVKRKQHKAMADQLAMVSKQCLCEKMAKLNEDDLEGVSGVIRVQLSL